ncbi:MAG: hypothetical protein ABR974_05155 [Bacteroidales bacterium]
MYLCTGIKLIINPLAANNYNSQKPILEGVNPRTLVYFASGPYKDKYEFLPFNRVYLIDFCFAENTDHNIKVSKSGKVICLGMDCLFAVDYLKKSKVKIDCFVALNEGLFEGGGYYAINSDMFLGYVMPILKDEYIHIINKNYYGNQYHVSMDLPYQMTAINESNQDYLDPFLFSDDNYHKGHAKVYRMKKQTSVGDLNINPNIQISIIHDSIWNHADELDLLAISIRSQGQDDFFHGVSKVISLRDISVEQILDFCVLKKINRIGITPWSNGKYSSFIDQVKNYSKEYPKSISLFHLNKNDYKSLRELA